MLVKLPLNSNGNTRINFVNVYHADPSGCHHG